jgi:predicted membrane protein
MRELESLLGSPFFLLVRIPVTLSWIPFLMGNPLLGMGLWIVTGFIAGWLAKRKGRNAILWGVCAGLFWGVGFTALACVGYRPGLSPKPEESELHTKKNP